MPETKKKIPICWKCTSKITDQNLDGASFTLTGCKKNGDIKSYDDAEKMCPILFPKNKVLIIINGGVAQLEEKPLGVEVEIRDYDVEGIDAEGDERCKKDEDGDWYQLMLWEPIVEVP